LKIRPDFASEAAVSQLHISKVAVGCSGLEALRRRQEGRLVSGGSAPSGVSFVPIVTRFRPKRAEELLGGSIYWILQHRLTARQRILRFADSAGDGRTIIELDPELVPVRLHPKRAHQGWRYLPAQDAPADLAEGDVSALLPPPLAQALSELALI
jgi:hypothetical protein